MEEVTLILLKMFSGNFIMGEKLTQTATTVILNHPMEVMMNTNSKRENLLYLNFLLPYQLTNTTCAEYRIAEIDHVLEPTKYLIESYATAMEFLEDSKKDRNNNELSEEEQNHMYMRMLLETEPPNNYLH